MVTLAARNGAIIGSLGSAGVSLSAPKESTVAATCFETTWSSVKHGQKMLSVKALYQLSWLPSGKRLQFANLKMTIEIVDLPIDSMVIFHSYVSLPGGITVIECYRWLFLQGNHSINGVTSPGL